ncbi:hypothetical protein AHAS_Ahas18G0167200 [Arachis hypogaea]
MISAFVKQWHPKIYSFHMSFGECTITLQDVVYQLYLSISGCLSDFEQLMDGGKLVWVWF